MFQDWEPVVLTKTKPGAAGGDAAKKGGTSKQTAVGVDVRNLEDEESDARYIFNEIVTQRPF